MGDRTLTTVAAEELLGYGELTQLPESTGTEKLVLKRGNLFAVTLQNINIPGLGLAKILHVNVSVWICDFRVLQPNRRAPRTADPRPDKSGC